MKVGFKYNKQFVLASKIMSELEGVIWRDTPEGFDPETEILIMQNDIIIIVNKDVVTDIPEEVTARQARLALVANGVTLEQIDALINSMSEPDKSLALISWEYEPLVRRHSVLVINIGHALGLSDTQIDNLFVQAASL